MFYSFLFLRKKCILAKKNYKWTFMVCYTEYTETSAKFLKQMNKTIRKYKRRNL